MGMALTRRDGTLAARISPNHFVSRSQGIGPNGGARRQRMIRPVQLGLSAEDFAKHALASSTDLPISRK